ncbi:hypothetical protein [Candidatus Solirubrobacter pratensis]|uniref:hypothetical protein n=1 Tax=Candidatus Solirubrobacter pratensis TaxID=1298857 RepID=UPI0003FE1F73|nr:hypothetical protein [Candidatus Solirubrobacter pratensis]
MELPVLVPIEYRGELVALVSCDRVHIIAPSLLDRPPADPDLRFVAFMCACCGEVLNGRIPGPFTNELGELWARTALIPSDELAALQWIPEHEAARQLNVPQDQLRAARTDTEFPA